MENEKNENKSNYNDNNLLSFFDGLDAYKEIISDIPYLSKISPAYIQRRYKVNYDIASKIMDKLEAGNIIGPANGSKPRDIIKK